MAGAGNGEMKISCLSGWSVLIFHVHVRCQTLVSSRRLPCLGTEAWTNK